MIDVRPFRRIGEPVLCTLSVASRSANPGKHFRTGIVETSSDSEHPHRVI